MNLRDPVGTGIPVPALESSVAEIFAAFGIPAEGAQLAARALVAAELEGHAAYGLRLVPAFAARLGAGSITTHAEPEVVHDGGSSLVLDGRNALGHLTADWALPMAIERARSHGVACVAIRNSTHFGRPAFWARQVAEAGVVGLIMTNSPARPACALAVPVRDAAPVLVDVTEPSGDMDPVAAVAALLVPDGGPAAVALATTVDLLCSALSGGAFGREVAPLHGDPQAPQRASHLFLAFDPARFGAANLAERMAQLAPAQAPEAPQRDQCFVPPEVLAQLRECAAKVMRASPP